MSETESYGSRLEKKIDKMQSDIHMLSDHVTRLTFINESHNKTAEGNRKDIDGLLSRTTNLEAKSATLEGAVSSTRVWVGFFVGIFFMAVGWVFSSIIQSSQQVNINSEKLTRVEKDIESIHRNKRENNE